MKITATLDVAPKMPNAPVSIAGDEPVPFQKKSNYITYRYCITTDTEQLIENPSQLDSKFVPVPSEGITLSGYTDGDYIVFVDSPADMEPAIAHQRITHTANPAVALPQFTTDTRAEYYDLQGRKLRAPARGSHIIRQDSTTRLSL